MRYRKKPLEIEAFKWDGTKLDGRYPIELFKQYNIEWHYGHAPGDGMLHELVIETLEGEMIVEVDDYVIIGIKGEVYPCKPDIFEMSYDLI